MVNGRPSPGLHAPGSLYIAQMGQTKIARSWDGYRLAIVHYVGRDELARGGTGTLKATKAAAQTQAIPESADIGGKRGKGLRRVAAGTLLSAAVALSLAAGGWGLLSAQVPQTAHAVDARNAVAQGEVAEVPGGLLRVDKVIPEHMAPMQMDKFKRSGMNMSGMGIDMVPEGKRRFTVDVSLAAGPDGLNYSKEEFRLTGEGMKAVTPIRSRQLGDGMLPAGSEMHGPLVFQTPQDASELMLSFDGGEPVALDLGKDESSGHEEHKGASASGEDSQGGGSSDDGHDH